MSCRVDCANAALASEARRILSMRIRLMPTTIPNRIRAMAADDAPVAGRFDGSTAYHTATPDRIVQTSAGPRPQK